MIGVIAALTLPTLMNSTNDKEIVARVKKVRASLNEAYGRAYAKYGPIETWNLKANDYAYNSEKILKRVTEFMQVEKNCGVTADSSCFNISGFTKPIVGNATGTNYYGYSRVLLSDGTALAFGGSVLSSKRASITVDIDGPKKGKFQIGTDIFLMYIDFAKNSVISVYDGTDDMGTACRAGSSSACTNWIFQNDNADYLNCAVTEANPTCN